MKKFLALGMAVCFWSQVSWAKAAPSFTGDLLNGGRTSLSKHLKEAKDQKKMLLVSFWATWCAPCIQEMKEITAKLNTEKDFPLSVLTVNVDTSETASDVKPTIKQYGFELPVVLDPKHEIFQKYQASKSLPFSVLISANGEIAETFSGYNEEMFTTIKKKMGGTTEKVNSATSVQ